jgi:hypothetical protein
MVVGGPLHLSFVGLILVQIQEAAEEVLLVTTMVVVRLHHLVQEQAVLPQLAM